MTERDLALEIRRLLERYNQETGRTCEVHPHWVEVTVMQDLPKRRYVIGSVSIVSEQIDRIEATE